MTTILLEEYENRLKVQSNDLTICSEILKFLRENKIRKPELVIRAGLPFINSSWKSSILGDDLWSVCEQTFLAALDANLSDIAEKCLKKKIIGVFSKQ